MTEIGSERYRVRVAKDAADLRDVQQLRFEAFFPGGAADGLDGDVYDANCQHILIRHAQSGRLTCCFRLLLLESGDQIEQSYSAQFYDLTRLQRFAAPMAELGRFCVAPGNSDPDVIRLAWVEIARLVRVHAIELLIGCSSFAGTDPAQYAPGFALLRAQYLAPAKWMPTQKSPNVIRFSETGRRREAPRAALAGLPPLLRSYVLMGGWVSDHAVIDQRLNTLHVFTGLEIRAVARRRARLLQRTAARCGS